MGTSIPSESLNPTARQNAAHIEDTWDALGLRGTGSHHLTLQDQRIPVEHMAAPIYEPARHDGPPWRLGLFDLAGILMSGFPLGVARRAIDEFTTMARTKFRGSPANTVAGNDHAQMLLAQAESRLRAARLYVYDVVAGVWDNCCADDRPAPAQRAELALAGCHAMRTALEAVDSLYRLAGAEAVFAGHPLERCFEICIPEASTSSSARFANRNYRAFSSASTPPPTDHLVPDRIASSWYP